MNSSNKPKPPQPPQHKHKMLFYSYQVIGVLVIVTITVLALFDFFGETEGKENFSAESISVEVTYPSKFRYKTIHSFDITVENTSSTTGTALVNVEKKYLDKFSNVTFFPQPREITDKFYVFEIGPVPPGENRVITGKVQAEQYGRFSGLVSAGFEADSTSTTTITTITFP